MQHNLLDILQSAHNTLNPVAALSLYEKVRQETRDNKKTLHLYAQATRELAYLSTNKARRAVLWKETYTKLLKASEDINLYFLEQAAITLKDMIQDEFNGLDVSFLRRELTNLFKQLSCRISESDKIPEIKSRLLARRSSLLRLRSERFDIAPYQKRRTLEEALRCAEKAVSISETTGAQFELALCIWGNAMSAKSDKEYQIILERVESLLSSPYITELEVAKITLGRFYRQNYRPFEACETFDKLTDSVQHKRRFLLDIANYAEAAIQLWFQKYPEHDWKRHCENSLFLVREAIDSGYRNARMFVNIAFLHAIMGDNHAANCSLHEIADVSQDSIWNKLIELSLSPEKLDDATEGLCFGLNNGAVWTRLGTFVWTFYDDKKTAQALYEFAVKLNPCNPVALTNLARFYLVEDTEYSTIEVEKLLHKAGSYANRRFRWWKDILDKTSATLKQSSRRVTQIPSLRRSQLSSKLSAIRSRYKQICNIDSPQQRGYALECLVFDLAGISFTVAIPSYRFRRDSKSQTQIDGYIEHRGEKYRIECKWEKDPISKNHFPPFLHALDAAGISGLFVSMSGYSDSFIECVREYRKERAVILFDREDLEAAVQGTVNFDELLTFKRRSFDRTSEPYTKYTIFQD